MELEYVRLGIEAKSKLNPEQRKDFYDTLNATVWKVRVKHRRSNHGDTFSTGVSIIDGQLILTNYVGHQNSEIFVKGLAEKNYVEVEVVHSDEMSGLMLLKTTRKSDYNYVKFALETSISVGQHLYALTYTKEAQSPLFLMGNSAHFYIPDFTPDNVNVLRTVNQFLHDVYPNGLGEDVNLLQVARLGSSNECTGTMMGERKNDIGYADGRGSPVFNATGHLVGIVSFQMMGFDMVIPIHHVQVFISRYERRSQAESSSS